ncbi:MAG: hypothetical protein EZS28_012786 [Streblomastix strix]|uniref:Uncharacterized protein n=1 Tax=Streblomastix strix TaxID=222440 RepID=A0A5J4W9T1_9EUKA|nr:MAG: hypothetical protein EZS28_012786 [Streblomastix strix]
MDRNNKQLIRGIGHVKCGQIDITSKKSIEEVKQSGAHYGLFEGAVGRYNRSNINRLRNKTGRNLDNGLDSEIIKPERNSGSPAQDVRDQQKILSGAVKEDQNPIREFNCNLRHKQRSCKSDCSKFKRQDTSIDRTHSHTTKIVPYSMKSEYCLGFPQQTSYQR